VDDIFSTTLSSLCSEFSGGVADRFPWQQRTPPLSLLRLLGIRTSLDSSDPPQRRPPGAPVKPGLTRPKHSDTSSNRSLSFFAGLSPLKVVDLHQKDGNGARLRTPANLSDEVDERKRATEIVNGLMRLPHLQITPGDGRGQLSRDRGVTTAAVGDVTNTTKAGNRGDTSTASGATVTHSKDTDSITAKPKPKVESSNKKDAMEPSYDYDEDESDSDSETDDGHPFHAVGQKHLPVWPVPQHHMILYQPAQQNVGPPSFGGVPGQHPMYGINGPPPPSTSGRAQVGWNGQVHSPAASYSTKLPEISQPVNEVVTDDGTPLDGDADWRESSDRAVSRLNVEEESTTSTTTGQPRTTSADDTAALNDNDTGSQGNDPRSSGNESTTTRSTTVGVSSTERSRITWWRAASWGRSTGTALSPTSFHCLLGMCTKQIRP